MPPQECRPGSESCVRRFGKQACLKTKLFCYRDSLQITTPNMQMTKVAWLPDSNRISKRKLHDSIMPCYNLRKVTPVSAEVTRCRLRKAENDAPRRFGSLPTARLRSSRVVVGTDSWAAQSSLWAVSFGSQGLRCRRAGKAAPTGLAAYPTCIGSPSFQWPGRAIAKTTPPS